MFGMKPPLRLAIGALLLDGTPRAPQAVFEALLPDYPGERQLSPESVKRHLQALKVVGIARVEGESLDGSGNLVQTYALTGYGRRKVEAAELSWTNPTRIAGPRFPEAGSWGGVRGGGLPRCGAVGRPVPEHHRELGLPPTRVRPTGAVRPVTSTTKLSHCGLSDLPQRERAGGVSEV